MGDFNIILNQPATQPPPIQRYDLQGASSYYAYEENGRSYHAYKPGIYPYPADECERNRCDMLHHLVHGIILGHWTRRDGLAAAVARPLVQQSADSILDLGCGSGNWVIDMADQFPDAEVVGVDLVGGQPKDTPRITWRTPDSGSNNPLDFDGDQDWGFLGNTFDLIHAAHLCGGISDWSVFLRKIRKYLRPRSGQVELIEIDLEPRCDDGTLPRDSALYEWWRMMLEAGRRSGKSIAYPHNTGGLLQDARFADIKHQEHQLPFSFSANWVRPGMKTRAEWYNIMVTDPGDRYDPVATFNAYSMALFTRYLGLSRAQVDDLVARVSLDVSNPNYHIFHVLHVWTARRPGSDESHL